MVNIAFKVRSALTDFSFIFMTQGPKIKSRDLTLPGWLRQNYQEVQNDINYLDLIVNHLQFSETECLDPNIPINLEEDSADEFLDISMVEDK